jgi:uncharacterized protein (DUF1778 family)
MGHLSLDLPNSIRRHLHELAAAEGVSVEQFVASAITEKVVALLAEDHLRRHAAGASTAAMQAMLDKVPLRPPLPGDD